MNLIRVILMLFILNKYISDTSSVPKADTTKPENHISEQDPNILNLKLMVSHYDCTKQNNLRQIRLLFVEPCKEAPIYTILELKLQYM